MRRPPAKPPDAIADGYEGSKYWEVVWSERFPVTVAAPTQEAAMVTAARFWGVRWQAESYHQTVQIIPV